MPRFGPQRPDPILNLRHRTGNVTGQSTSQYNVILFFTMIYNTPFLPFILRKASVAPQLTQSTTCLPFISLRMASTLPNLPIFAAIASHDPQSTAVIHSASGRRFSYGSLLKDVADNKDRLHKESGSSSIAGQRIAFLIENSYDYVGAVRQTSRSISDRR